MEKTIGGITMYKINSKQRHIIKIKGGENYV